MFTLIEIVLSVGVLVTLVTALSVCVCGCKHSNQKSELVGTPGVVKIRFEEEAPSPTPTTPASIKRASTQNSQRSLPEIPHPVGRHDSGDTASEIYATVNLVDGNKTEATASTSRDHPYEHAYAKLQNEAHNITVEITPDQRADSEVEINERESGQNGADSVVISASVAISGQLPSSQELPYITPPSPRPHIDPAPHFSGDSTDSAKGYTSISVREPLSNIRAQNAKPQPPPQPHYATVSDDSDEMYAAIEEASVGEGSDTYAQIAPEPRRRDPPAPSPPAPTATPAPTPSSPTPTPATPDLLHTEAAHIARRSAPPEVGASTSRGTHSRQASSSSCSNSTGALGSPKPEKRQANSPLPPPPHAPHTHPHAHAHTHVNTHAHAHAPRPAVEQALANKHQRISSTGDLHFNHDKLRRSLNEKHQRNNSCVSSSDFYGCNYPVEKHRFSSGDIIRPLVARELNFDIDNDANNLYNSIEPQEPSTEPEAGRASEPTAADSPPRNFEEMYAKVMKKTKTRTEDVARRSKDFPNADEQRSSNYRSEDPGYETIDRKKSANHGYETIARKERSNSQNQDPGYETVKEIHRLDFDKQHLKVNSLDSGPNSIVSSDPGYEHIAKNDTNASDSDPNYEVLRNQPATPPYATIPPDYNVAPTYSTVNKIHGRYNNWGVNNNGEVTTESNYESMPHDPLYNTGSESDPNYESVRPKGYESESAQDPNYESLKCKDPKYESVRSKESKYESFRSKDSKYESFRSKDSKYESVRSKDSKYDSVRSKKDPNYESVKYFELSRKEPPYEKVDNESGTNSTGVERSDSSAGYEKINVQSERDPKNSINGADATVSDYFQV